MEPFKPGTLSEESYAERVPRLFGDEQECGCGQWFPRDARVCCDICGKATCGGCVRPAMEPVTVNEYMQVCPTCRQAIDDIDAALRLYAHRRAIAEGLTATVEALQSLADLALDEHPRVISEALGGIVMMQSLYGLKGKVG